MVTLTRETTTMNNKIDAPDLDVHQAREYLGYSHIESIYKMAEKGSLNGGFDAYVYAKDKHGYYSWQKKIGRTGHERLPLMFYSKELEKWKNEHPAIERQRVLYSAEEKAEVLEQAEKYKDEEGRVARGKLFSVLVQENGWRRTHVNYGVLKQVLDDAEIPALHNVKRTTRNVKRRKS